MTARCCSWFRPPISPVVFTPVMPKPCCNRCVRALEFNVAIGAHPGFADRKNFGRSPQQLPPETVYAQVVYQLGALKALAEGEGGKLVHVKPHGALYNQAAKDPVLADAIARAVRVTDRALVLVGLANSELICAGKRHGLTTRQEVFADRAYQSDGSLVARGQPGALIESDEQAIRQTLTMIQKGQVQSLSGDWVKVQADSICLHGDGPHALDFACRLRQALSRQGIEVSSH
ncbi:LamB/YcsF family protein [Erwinia amylovora MR1]|nr:LamB/YcsF family protein [Erwinia amylovora MR1]